MPIQSLILTLFFSSVVFAEGILTPHWVNQDEYLSGEKYCVQLQEQIKNEKSFRVNVPVDYQDPSQGTTSLYAFFEKDFDPQLPTLAFFSGGPGQPAHGTILLSHLGMNVLTFDQRGVACSRPEKFATYRDPKFYSSEKTARDLEEIRRQLHIEQWTVMGVSYGTVAATIYGHLFPEHTRAVILEGVVFASMEELWTAPHRRRILQRYLKVQKPEFRNFLTEMITKYDLPDFWFSMVARNFLLGNHGLDSITEFINKMRESESIRQSVIDLFHAPRQSSEDITDMDVTVLTMIGCQELGLASPGTTPYDRWTGADLEQSHFLTKKEYCDTLGVSPLQHQYAATDFPLRVPVTYFEGALDGATEAPFAVKHYKNNPKGPAQILIMPKGGHSADLTVLYQVFINPTDKQYPLQEGLFMSALMGEKINPAAVQHFNKLGPDRWALAQKNWPVSHSELVPEK